MTDEYIPCEICDLMIEFSQYMSHLEECQSRNTTFIRFPEFSFSNLQNSDSDSDNDNNNSDGSEEEEVNSFQQFRSMMNNLLQHMPELNQADSYQALSNLEDVEVPCKDIDKVAPLIPSDQIDQIPYQTICPICKELISSDARKTICNHYFCSACLEPWLEVVNKTCPVCTIDLDDLYQEKHPEEKYLSSPEESDKDSNSLDEFIEDIENEVGYITDPDNHSEKDSEEESEKEDSEEEESEKED